MSARLASQSGRRVGAVPGPITSGASAGPNSLLAEGATLVRDAADVLEALG
jgi:DNA processing protein